jgi:hypothetical protein
MGISERHSENILLAGKRILDFKNLEPYSVNTEKYLSFAIEQPDRADHAAAGGTSVMAIHKALISLKILRLRADIHII